MRFNLTQASSTIKSSNLILCLIFPLYSSCVLAISFARPIAVAIEGPTCMLNASYMYIAYVLHMHKVCKSSVRRPTINIILPTQYRRIVQNF